MELKDITEDNIEDIADSPAIMSRGRSYFLEGRVINLRITNKNIIAIVQGGSKYKVEILMTMMKSMLNATVRMMVMVASILLQFCIN